MSHVHSAAWGGSQSGSGRWGHWGPQILIASIFGTVVLVIAPLPTTNPLAALSPALLVAVVLATWVQMRRHDRGLCEHCLASMPLNPAAEAQRFQRRLALAHLGANKRAVVGYLLILLAADLLLMAAPPAQLQAATFVWAAVQSTLVYLVLSHVTHRRLQPWCVQCGSGGDGGHDHVPDPTPIDSRSR